MESTTSYTQAEKDATRLDGRSLDVTAEKLAQLKQLLPEVFAEGKLDVDKLRLVLGEDVYVGEERYGLNWPGKAEAYKEIQKRTTATLVPDREGSVDFDTAENVFIEGENLEVLKVLNESYHNSVRMIYIDPPYNTGSDYFVYPDDYSERRSDFEKRTGIVDEFGYINKADLINVNRKDGAHFHSNWLNMLYPRLLLAKQLLAHDGVIFVSIDENEVATLKLIMSEIFGEENFRNTFTIRRYDKNLNRQFIEQGLSTFNTGFEYILCYSKSPDFTFSPVYKASSEARQNFGYWKGFWNDADRPTMRYQLLGYKPETGQWKWKQETGAAGAKNYEEYQKSFADKMTLEEYWESTGKKLQFIRRNPNGKGMNKGVEHWIPPTSGILRNTNWTDIFASKAEPETQGYFDYPKNIDLIKELIRLGEGSESDIILDFFAGSGSTAHAVLAYNQEQKKNHKFLCIQYAEKLAETSDAFEAGLRTIADITRLRLKAVIANKKTKAAGDLYGTQLNLSGFRAFKCMPSNFKVWNPSVSGQQLLFDLKALQQTEISESEEAKLFEILLALNYQLSLPIEKVKVVDTVLYNINEKNLIVALDSINQAIIDYVVQSKVNTLACLDSLFQDDDQFRTNVHLELNEHNIQLKTY